MWLFAQPVLVEFIRRAAFQRWFLGASKVAILLAYCYSLI